MRSRLESERRRAVRTQALIGVAAIVGGATLMLWPAVDDVRFGFAGLFGLILGSTLLVPGATLGIVTMLGRSPVGFKSSLVRTVVRSVGASLSRTGVALAALMLAVATSSPAPPFA